MTVLDAETIRARVERGFAILTRAQRDRVDIDKLNMQDGWDCILGQIFGWFGSACDQLFPTTSGRFDLERAEEHGFYIEAESDMFTNYAALQREWIRRLELEREITELLQPVGSL